MVPALRAARQMVRAFSSATRCPPSGATSTGRNCPIALSLSETSVPEARPFADSAASTSRYAATVASACARSLVSSPRQSSVAVRPSAASSPAARTASSVPSPGT